MIQEIIEENVTVRVDHDSLWATHCSETSLVVVAAVTSCPSARKGGDHIDGVRTSRRIVGGDVGTHSDHLAHSIPVALSDIVVTCTVEAAVTRSVNSRGSRRGSITVGGASAGAQYSGNHTGRHRDLADSVVIAVADVHITVVVQHHVVGKVQRSGGRLYVIAVEPS